MVMIQVGTWQTEGLVARLLTVPEITAKGISRFRILAAINDPLLAFNHSPISSTTLLFHRPGPCSINGITCSMLLPFKQSLSVLLEVVL